ncbi:hypothetical protein B0H14DRAFT_2647207 [Mycena olivaceomarginata]|nr:hypothetical protein B0H14DRAFT_2647207 [Mycena olivaceomarginata]
MPYSFIQINPAVEYAQAVEYVALFSESYERQRAGISWIVQLYNRSQSDNRLDFDHIEHRPFFLAVHRQTTLSLDPANDPHGALLHLDFLAVKTRPRHGPMVTARTQCLICIPLDPTAGTAALIEAIRDFPSVVPLLADKLDVSLSNTIRSHRDFKIETDGTDYLLAPEAALHLLSTCTPNDRLPSRKTKRTGLQAPTVPKLEPTLLDILARHGAREDYRQLFSYIPRDVLAGKTLQCDLLSPPTAVTSYNDAFFEGTEDLRAFRPSITARQRAQHGRVLAQMIPDTLPPLHRRVHVHPTAAVSASAGGRQY